MTNNLGVSVGTDATVATDDVSGVHYQVVKLAVGTEDSSTRITAGGGVEAAALRVTIASDSTGVLSVDDNGSSLSIDDGGNLISIDDGAGTITVDDGGTTLSIDDGGGNISIDDGGNVITIDGTPTVKGTVAHDAADADAPVKAGARARSGLIAAVAQNDVTDQIADLYGRLQVTHIDPAQQVWKSTAQTTTQTGLAVWTPASGKKIALTYLQVTIGGTTGGDVTVWFGASGDTTYTAGTDQLVGLWHVIPAAAIKQAESPAPMIWPFPLFAATADYILRLTTSANVTVDLVAYGYEF